MFCLLNYSQGFDDCCESCSLWEGRGGDGEGEGEGGGGDGLGGGEEESVAVEEEAVTKNEPPGH